MNLFERFLEAVQERVSRAPFFLLCLGVVLVWLVSAPLWPDLKQWQVAIHTRRQRAVHPVAAPPAAS